MKRSALTIQQRDALEALLASHGLVVTSEQVAGQVAHLSEQSRRRFVSRLVEAGWLVRIQKGLYQIADIGSLGTLTISRLTIAQLLVPDSYVSFRSALQHHGLFDQGLKSVGSVALRRRSPVALEGTTYTFVTTKERYFFGFSQVALNGKRVRVATPEKACLDLLQFRRTQASVDLVLEILREQGHHLDTHQLTEYAVRLPVAVQQVIGYLLEMAGIDERGILLGTSRQGSGVAWLTPESRVYNSRWRLYIDPYFTDQEVPA